MKVMSKKTLYLDGSSDEYCTFRKGNVYEVKTDGYEDLYTTDEMGSIHYIVEEPCGGVNDPWFKEHFEIIDDLLLGTVLDEK